MALTDGHRSPGWRQGVPVRIGLECANRLQSARNGEPSADATSRLDSIVAFTIKSNDLAIASASTMVSSEGIERTAQSVAATSEELSASVTSIDAGVRSSRDRTSEILSAAQRSESESVSMVDAMQRASEAMRLATATSDEVAAATNRIVGVVETIDSIAMQTNLLALNASIEDARAGEAGRGFGVVATEVRLLSEQTRKATVGIRQMIESFKQEVSGIMEAVGTAGSSAAEGRKRMEKVGSVVKSLVVQIGGIDERLSSIATAVSEQAVA